MTQIRWGLIGCGKQGSRYLEPRNNGGRNMFGFGRGVRIEADAVVIATPPASHAELAIECLQLGIAVLLEKPVALTRAESMAVLDAAACPGAPPLMVSLPHLWNREFLRLKPRGDASVIWVGPEREDGSCSGYLDWAFHGHSMGLALDTRRVCTGKSDERINVASSNGVEYGGRFTGIGPSPMLGMVETLEKLMRGQTDWRCSLPFLRTVCANVFENAPASLSMTGGRPTGVSHERKHSTSV